MTLVYCESCKKMIDEVIVKQIETNYYKVLTHSNQWEDECIGENVISSTYFCFYCSAIIKEDIF